MKRISFMLTPEQFLNGTKDVTRRLGWGKLKAGDKLLAVSKCMGLKPGEKAEMYGPIEVVSATRVPLRNLTPSECCREGFPEMSTPEFVEFFCKSHRGCKPETVVTRIEFRRLTDNRVPLAEVPVIESECAPTRRKVKRKRDDIGTDESFLAALEDRVQTPFEFAAWLGDQLQDDVETYALCDDSLPECGRLVMTRNGRHYSVTVEETEL